jgi:DNA-binding CsgD family transcriptional regulator
MAESKTQQALKLLAAQPERTVYSVAKQLGISPTTIYTTIARKKAQETRERCKCCGQLLPQK